MGFQSFTGCNHCVSHEAPKGPFCEQQLYKTVSLTSIPLTIHHGHLIVYSYMPYAHLFLQYEIQGNSRERALLPMWAKPHYPGVSRYGYHFSVDWRTYQGPATLVLLPHRQIERYLHISILRYDLGHVTYMLHMPKSPYCKVCPVGIRKTYVRLSVDLSAEDCQCFEPVLVFTSKHHTRRIIASSNQSNYVSPLYPQHLLCHLASNTTFIIKTIPKYDNAFSLINILLHTCSHILVRIDHGSHTPGSNRGHMFSIEKTLTWKTGEASATFALSLVRSDNCSVKVNYHSGNFTFNLEDWFDLDRIHKERPIAKSRRPTPVTCRIYTTMYTLGRRSITICSGLRCYLLIPPGRLTWNEAEQRCKDRHCSMVTINSYEEFDILRYIYHQYLKGTSAFMFLGLTLEQVSNLIKGPCTRMTNLVATVTFRPKVLHNVTRQLAPSFYNCIRTVMR